jgi:hypothetical protein
MPDFHIFLRLCLEGFGYSSNGCKCLSLVFGMHIFYNYSARSMMRFGRWMSMETRCTSNKDVSFDCGRKYAKQSIINMFTDKALD